MVLAEAGLELVPEDIQSHPAIVKNAKKRGKHPSKTLLDISLHYKAMKSLDKWYKRGRPDIVHISLLCALSSPLNLANLLRVYIHTVNNIVIHVDPAVRIPRNYNRFVGLVEQLLLESKVPPGSEKPLMWVEKTTLKNFVQESRCDKVVVMHEHGTAMPLKKLGNHIADHMQRDENVCVIVGAFQHGDFGEETLSLADELVSIFPRPLDTWVVVSRVIESVEVVLNIV